MKPPPRYLVTWREVVAWREAEDYDWHQTPYARIPVRFAYREGFSFQFPYLLENLETGEVIGTNFDLREQAHFATTDWALRKKLQRQWQTFLALKTKTKPVPDPVRLATRKLDALLKLEKQWLRKSRLAATKLRKLRARIQRLKQRVS